MSISETIKKRIESGNGRYWAGDNISQYLEEGDKQKLIDELTEEEIDALGLNVNYAEFMVDDFLALVYKEKEFLCADSKLI